MVEIIRRPLIGILILGLIFSGFIGCVDNNVVDEGDAVTVEPPELPPVSSMTMDFSAFGGGKLAPSRALAAKNFGNAVTRVLLLDVAVILVLSPPVAFFKTAAGTIPVRQDDGSWLWDYTVNFLGQKYDVDLTGRLVGLKTVWSMKVTNTSRQIPLEDFEWYSGEAALDNKSGSWRFFDPATPNETNQIATIEWSIRADKSEIVFSNTNGLDLNFGDVLSYSVEGTMALIAFYDASKNITADITWELETIAGSIKVPDYNDGERACWDENQQDVVCR